MNAIRTLLRHTEYSTFKVMHEKTLGDPQFSHWTFYEDDPGSVKHCKCTDWGFTTAEVAEN